MAGLGGSVGLKCSSGAGEEGSNYIADTMKKDTFYLVGAGTTTRA